MSDCFETSFVGFLIELGLVSSQGDRDGDWEVGPKRKIGARSSLAAGGNFSVADRVFFSVLVIYMFANNLLNSRRIALKPLLLDSSSHSASDRYITLVFWLEIAVATSTSIRARSTRMVNPLLHTTSKFVLSTITRSNLKMINTIGFSVKFPLIWYNNIEKSHMFCVIIDFYRLSRDHVIRSIWPRFTLIYGLLWIFSEKISPIGSAVVLVSVKKKKKERTDGHIWMLYTLRFAGGLRLTFCKSQPMSW